jgi:hypothetical protein
MRRRSRRWPSRLALLLALASAAGGVGAEPQDVRGWRQARWGMSEAELEAAFGRELMRPEAAPEFDGLVVHEIIPQAAVSGRPFIAYFQLDPKSLRLKQVLLTYRGKRPTHTDYATIARGLEAELGPSDETKTERFYQSVPGFRVERVWRRPTTTVTLHFSQPNFEHPNGERGSLTLRYSASP